MAVNVLAMKDLCEGHAAQAVMRYEALLHQWRSHPEWQMDQASLLLLICSQFQVACFYSLSNPADLRDHLAQLPDFKAFSPAIALDFQRILYRNQLTLSLNTGNFEAVVPLIGEIDAWLQDAGSAMTEVQTLLFLHNLAIAEFLQGRFSAANRYVLRILHMDNRKVRQDIREFALVLQAVVQFALGDLGLTEYLVRAGKRQFQKKDVERGFEWAVFGFLERSVSVHKEEEQARELKEFIAALDGFAQQAAGGIPILGLTEVRLWAVARQSGKAIREVFLEAVKENLEAPGSEK
jgi:hypothetical protein